MFKIKFYKYLLVTFSVLFVFNIVFADTTTPNGKAMPWIPLLLLDENQPTPGGKTGPVLTGPSTVKSDLAFALSWTYSWPMIVSTSDGYELEESTTSANSGFTQIWSSKHQNDHQSPKTLVITSYKQPGTYYYRVRAYHSGTPFLFSDWSNIHQVVVTANTVNLNPPSVLTATIVSQTEVNLSWQDNSDNEDGFNIYEAPNSCDNTFVLMGAVGPDATSEPITGLSPGTTACYRITAFNSSGESEPSNNALVTTPGGSVATLRIKNNSHYDMIDIQLGGQQQLAYPNVIRPGQLYDFKFNTSGTVNFFLAVGFYNTNGTRDLWFEWGGDTTVNVGQTSTITFNNPTIGQLLSDFKQGGRDWIGMYLCYSCPVLNNYAKFHFGYNGSWTLYDNDVYFDQGTVSLSSWPNYSLSVKFRLNTGEDEIVFFYPFRTFSLENGPPDWPMIEYVAQ